MTMSPRVKARFVFQPAKWETVSNVPEGVAVVWKTAKLIPMTGH